LKGIEKIIGSFFCIYILIKKWSPISMKNFIDPMPPHYQKPTSRKLENPEAEYPMHQK